MIAVKAVSPRQDVEITHRLMRYIDERCDDQPTLQDMGAHVSMSPFHIQRVFKRVTGISPREYAEAKRLERFKAHLRDGRGVAAALYDAGYGSSSRAYERAPEKMGMTPATYSKGGEGMEIVYAIVDCRLGRVLVAKTERGVAAVHLNTPNTQNDDGDLEALLFAEYPLANISRNRFEYCEWVEAIVNHINDGSNEDKTDALQHLPLDIRATAFQIRVWAELLKIPFGETRTYGEIAAALGKPGAASMVADAVNANPVAIIIPCHRAERADGEPASFYSPRSREQREQLIAEERQTIEKDTLIRNPHLSEQGA